MLRLNLCSGQRPFQRPMWTNVDKNPRWNPDVVADCAAMPIFANDSADVIVISHGVEHYGCGEADMLIRECRRILCPGGSLIVTVPDMRALASAWLAGRLTTQVYLTCVYGAYMNDEADRHKFGYDRQSLAQFVGSCAPWSITMPFDWRTIPGMDLARDFWILGLEAIK